jgi:hypothetical protein
MFYKAWDCMTQVRNFDTLDANNETLFKKCLLLFTYFFTFFVDYFKNIILTKKVKNRSEGHFRTLILFLEDIAYFFIDTD